MSLLWEARIGVAACFLVACSRASAPPVATPPPSADAEYITISPDVSVSRNAQLLQPKQVILEERADVMAEILAIPPGR